MSADYQIDDLDRRILRKLIEDARASFVEIAKDLKVSGGTIHQRVNKMKLAGVLKGFQPVIDCAELGLTVSAMIGVHLKNAKDCNKVLEHLRKIPEVVEAHYTTGSYALIIKVVTSNIESFRLFLMEDLQTISEIQSTESFISLETPISRQAKI
ncbi:MAG: Lrp/AsnC ligand binding domain-containing protein [Pseudobdellovibrionaceae bacterium]